MQKNYIADFERHTSLSKSKENTKRSGSRGSSRASKTVVRRRLDDIGEALIREEKESLERKLIAQYDLVKSQAKSDISTLSNFIRHAEYMDCRKFGVGSHGGHIARELHAPGPHNGHLPVGEEDGLTVPDLKMNTPLKSFSRHPKPLNQPDWDPFFTLSTSLAGDSTPEKIAQDSNFKEEISKYRPGTAPNNALRTGTQPLMSKSVTHLAPLNENKNSTLAQSEFQNAKVENLQKMESYFLSPSKDRDVLNTNSSPGDMASKGKVEEARHRWQSLVVDLHVIASDIRYPNLVELASMREPPDSVVSIVGFIGVLLGLQPDWPSSRRSLFKELLPLQRFLREVVWNSRNNFSFVSNFDCVFIL